MSDEQPIKGYRVLSQTETDTINYLKKLEEQVAHVVTEHLRGRTEFDQRWVSIGQTHIEEGFSALVKSVARPVSPFNKSK
jgi:hypothetical protein